VSNRKVAFDDLPGSRSIHIGGKYSVHACAPLRIRIVRACDFGGPAQVEIQRSRDRACRLFCGIR
jgi:hypothetical protein